MFFLPSKQRRLRKRLGIDPKTGERDGLPARVRTFTTHEPSLNVLSKSGTREVQHGMVEVDADLPEGVPSFSIARQGEVTTWTGDRRFDGLYRCDTVSALHLLSLLTRSLRELLSADRLLGVHDGQVHFSGPRRQLTNGRVDRALAIAQRLTERAATVYAANGMPPERASTLLSQADADISDLAFALRGLLDTDPTTRVETLRGALAHPSRALRAAALTEIGENDVGQLVEVLATYPVGEHELEAASLLRALKLAQDPRCEEVLIQLLGVDDNPVQEGAADVLGHVGTLRAIAPLRRLEKKWGEVMGVQAAASVAISLIQGRHGSTQGQGGLALADEQSQGLALADEERGQLALEGADDTLAP